MTQTDTDKINGRILHIDASDDLEKHMQQIGVDPRGIKLMAPKGKLLCIKLYDIKAKWANILKQDLLSIGGDLAVSKDMTYNNVQSSDCIIIATLKHIKLLLKKLESQPSDLKSIREVILNTVNNFDKADHVLKLPAREFNLTRYNPLIMGIINLTPDSFSNDGVYKDKDINIDKIVEKAAEMQERGADILDLGGESTRPGSDPISEPEEIDRVIPVLEKISDEIDIPISIDTYKSKVADYALSKGATILNDISGLNADKNMSMILSKYKPGVILMHMKGMPKDMQNNPEYKDLIGEILNYFQKSIDIALGAGLEKENIVLDPGIGFGKTVDHNLCILKKLEEFKSLGYPILIGPSRKSFIGKILDLDVSERLLGTAASVAIAVEKGANIIRVHDVEQMKQVCSMIKNIFER